MSSYCEKTTNIREDILISSHASIPLVSEYVSNFFVCFFGSRGTVKIVKGVVATSVMSQYRNMASNFL